MREDKLKSKLGKVCTLRNGLKTSPLCVDPNNGTNYIYEAWVQELCYPTPSFMCWLPNGKALTDDIDHKHDIIVGNEVEKVFEEVTEKFPNTLNKLNDA
jgi:hypothetical protein